MSIAIISGSHRLESESERVAKYIQTELTNQGVSANLISLAGNPLPLWDEGVWEKTDTWQKTWGPYAKILQAATALVIISPEWAGMVPPGLKNFLLLCTHQDVGHKPALVVTVSSSRGGAYPLSELHVNAHKNNRLCIIPEHLIIRDVGKLLHGDTAQNEDDAYIRQRITYACRVLTSYQQALTHVRASGVIDHKNFPNGM